MPRPMRKYDPHVFFKEKERQVNDLKAQRDAALDAMAKMIDNFQDHLFITSSETFEEAGTKAFNSFVHAWRSNGGPERPTKYWWSGMSAALGTQLALKRGDALVAAPHVAQIVAEWQTRCESIEKERELLRAERDKLAAFKKYVHDRLDAAGVPSDPEPEKNAAHGCRIEGRLNDLLRTAEFLREFQLETLHDTLPKAQRDLERAKVEAVEGAFKMTWQRWLSQTLPISAHDGEFGHWLSERLGEAVAALKALPVLLVVLALSTSCAGRPVLCTTEHGMELLGPLPAIDARDPGAEPFTCETFQHAESVILGIYAKAEFATLKDPRFDGLGKKLAGYQVTLEPSEFLLNEDDKHVGGETWCKEKTIDLSNAPFLMGSLTHELAHVAQDCVPRGPLGEDWSFEHNHVIEVDPEHSNWERDGIWATLTIESDFERTLYEGNPNCFQGGHYVGPTDGTSCEAAP